MRSLRIFSAYSPHCLNLLHYLYFYEKSEKTVVVDLNLCTLVVPPSVLCSVKKEYHERCRYNVGKKLGWQVEKEVMPRRSVVLNEQNRPMIRIPDKVYCISDPRDIYPSIGVASGIHKIQTISEVVRKSLDIKIGSSGTCQNLPLAQRGWANYTSVTKKITDLNNIVRGIPITS